VKEYILCSAIYYNTQRKEVFQPDNVEDGIVVCGYRHCSCIEIKNQMKNFIYYGSPIQGFLTSENRFVDRKEALKIAKKSGQVGKTLNAKYLLSEDLY
jgi:hypothetical protein